MSDLKPDSFKGYTIGDNTHKGQSRHPWRMDDEKRLYPFYERLWKANIRNVCVHKGLFPPSVELQYPHLREYCDVRDVGRAAKDWAGWAADQWWTLARVAALIQRLFGVGYTLRGVSYLLHRMARGARTGVRMMRM